MPSPQALATIFVVAVMGSDDGSNDGQYPTCRPITDFFRHQYLIDRHILQSKTNSGYQYVCDTTDVDPKDVCDDLGYACKTGECLFVTEDFGENTGSLEQILQTSAEDCKNAAPVTVICEDCISYDTCGPVLHTDSGEPCEFDFEGSMYNKQCVGDFRGTPECPACQDPMRSNLTPHLCSGDNDGKFCCKGEIVPPPPPPSPTPAPPPSPTTAPPPSPTPASSSKKMSGGIVTVAVLAVLILIA